MGQKLLNSRGAIRVHGGGFAETVQAFVPTEMLSTFKSGVEDVFAPSTCHTLHIRPVGGCLIAD